MNSGHRGHACGYNSLIVLSNVFERVYVRDSRSSVFLHGYACELVA